MVKRSLLRSLAAAMLLVILLVTMLLWLPRYETLSRAVSALLMPGVWAVYSWAPLHAGSAFVLVHIVDIAFYTLLFELLQRAWRKSRERARPPR